MNWDPFQREVLAELGHVLYRQAGVAISSDVEVVRLDEPAADVAPMDSPMLIHVARAARMSTQALQASIDDIQVLASLRGNASAKRALWPRLRALRKQHR
ncbi:hypothetical protein [Thermomonas sp.]